jgi:hypothetical protein
MLFLGAGSSRPWLLNAQQRIQAQLSDGAPSSDHLEWMIRDSVTVLSDWQDHSIVSFAWALGNHKYPDHQPDEGVGYAALFQDSVFKLEDEQTFIQYLDQSKLVINTETQDHLAIGLECAVLGWTDQKCRINSVDDMRRRHLNLELYRDILDKIAPPRIEETRSKRRLIMWVYHWVVFGMMIQWAITQPKSGGLPSVGRIRQISPGAEDW